MNRAETTRRDHGFSLIELLVVIIIVGVLAAIAIPSYLSQRQKATEAGEEADARSVAAQMETYYVDAQRYPTPGELSWAPGPRAVEFGATGEIVRLSANNQARVLRSDTSQTFCVEVRNPSTQRTAVYASGQGGLQVTAAGAACPATYDTTVLDFPAA